MNEITHTPVTELALLEGTQLRTLKPQDIAIINQGMLEQKRVGAIFGRSNSQAMTTFMTLTMLNAPGCGYRLLRQCAAEIERRKHAIQENLVNLKKTEREIQYGELKAAKMLDKIEGRLLPATLASGELEDLDELAFQRDVLLLDVALKKVQHENGQVYMEGALKEVGHLINNYNQMRESHGIRENWDEADFEKAEIEHHVKSVYRLAFRDMILNQRISISTNEYAEQFGMHPMVVDAKTRGYFVEVNTIMQQHQQKEQMKQQFQQMFAAQPLLPEQHQQMMELQRQIQLMPDVQFPGIDHFFAWLDTCYQQHKDDYKLAAKELGITDYLTKWAMYVEQPLA